jgi:hypothetical protein
MKILYIASAFLAMMSANVFADGFDCTGLRYNQTRFVIENNEYNHQGTRSVCKVSIDGARAAGRLSGYVTSQFYGAACANFAYTNPSVVNEGARYVIKVDSRLLGQDSYSQKNSLVGPYLLTNLRTIILDLNFQYVSAYPVHDGDRVTGTATYFGETGSQMSENVVCTRKVKHPTRKEIDGIQL